MGAATFKGIQFQLPQNVSFLSELPSHEAAATTL
jgi:hypothetical protein